MELIATHLGADFDALASMVAARRLHPRARLFFPGSREESVRRMLESGYLTLEELRQRDIDPAGIERIILCDIRQRDRIGAVATWLEERPDIELVVYDHHPGSPLDLVPVAGRVDPTVGATSTLLAEELARRGVEVTPSEASLLLMGIYEDTGSLTYPTTSARDLGAAAWLLERGGDLTAVRRFAVHRLDAEHLEILHRMTGALEVHRIRGRRVGIVALELGTYVDELAPLVSRCLELFELPLVFGLFGDGERLTVIARGEVPGWDLGEFLAAFAGGGGHATAASGSLRGPTAIETRERLLEHLARHLPEAARARDLMVEPFHAVDGDETVGGAKQRINQWRVNAVPVLDGARRVVGSVSRQILDAAVQHGLAERPVQAVMQRELEWVDPDSPADALGDRILSRHPRFVLVGDPREGKPIGLVTRMHVLRHLYSRLQGVGEGLDRRALEQRELRQNVERLLAERLPAPLLERVRQIAVAAGERQARVFLVGGFVRDLLLGRENRDLDVVVEGDGPRFAEELGARIGARVRIHGSFLTAAILCPDGLRIDVATARSEFYRSPAALPEVQSGALRQDLYRRDFTINTLAIRLGPEPQPELIDYFGGRRDLRDRTLRVLHSLSFIDDPTRVLRAVRLELRLGFSLSPETCRLVGVALAEGVFDRLSGARLREELVLLLDDPMTAERGLERLEELGVLAVLQPRLRLTAAAQERLRRATAAYDWYALEGLRQPPVALWRLYLMALLAELEPRELAPLAERLAVVGEDRRVLAGFQARLRCARAALARRAVAAHEVAAALEPLAGEELLLLMAVEGEPGREWIRRALVELRPLRLTIAGADLLQHGHRPGPAIGRALRATRDARLDGQITPAEELEFALAVLRQEAARPPAAGTAPGAP